jgi:hypothetical protein
MYEDTCDAGIVTTERVLIIQREEAWSPYCIASGILDGHKKLNDA